MPGFSLWPPLAPLLDNPRAFFSGHRCFFLSQNVESDGRWLAHNRCRFAQKGHDWPLTEESAALA